MALRDCLISAADQGAITREEAQELSDIFDEHFKQLRLAMAEAPAATRAKDMTEKMLRAGAIEKRRQADLTEAARLTLRQRFVDNKDGVGTFDTAKSVLSHYGFRDGSSVRGRTEAIMATAHAAMGDFMFAFRRSGALGKRENRALHSDFVKELHGEHSGDATAKALANGVTKTFEDLRQRFNAAGGAIGKLENFGLPHSHDPLKIRGAKREPWKARMRGLLDASRMMDNLTGEPITPARLEAALDHAYENIVSEGLANMEPAARRTGLGAIAGRRQDERFFVFKDATAWLAYHREFGKGDVVQAVVNHVNAMAKDIAAMELLGPNPAAMVEWMKQVVARDIGRAKAGMPTQAKGSVFTSSHAEYIGWLWQTLRGNGAVSSGAMKFTDSVKNLVNAAVLGKVSLLAATTDPFIAQSARRLAGVPVLKDAGAMLKQLSRQNRDDIVRSGVVWDEYAHVMADDLRFFGPMQGPEWTRWLADRAMTWNGLKPLTTGRKLVEARAWQGHIADLAGAKKKFNHLDKRFRRALEGFGVTDDDWNIWTSAVDHNGFVTPMSILKKGGPVQYLDIGKIPIDDVASVAVEGKALAHRGAAEKLAELTSSWSERSVPSTTPNTRAAFKANTRRGTIPGELLEYFLQLKGFGLSYTALQLEALGEMASAKGGGKGFRTGLAYLAATAIPVTIGAAVTIQLKALLEGRDMEEMNSLAFLEKAVLTGGGFGLFGDFAKATQNRFGQSALEALQGPGIAFLSDVMGSLWRHFTDPDGEGRTAPIKFLERWTPVLSSNPLTSAAYKRVVLDNLQWATDPKADKVFKGKISRAKSGGSPYFLPPGTLTPSRKIPARRAPDWMNAVGR